MKTYITIVALLLITTLACKNQDQPKVDNSITTYYLVRHAEKDRSNPEEKNPNLTAEGLQRAERWNTVLSNIDFDDVYTTNFNRTKQTAAPIANQNDLKPIIYDTKELLNATFKDATTGKTVFIVGHSNTIPEIVNALIGTNKYDELRDDENGALFIVTISGNQVSDQLLIIN